MDNWHQLKKVFQTALALEPAQRASFIADACKGDDELRIQVEKLLAAHDESGSFLVSPAELVATNLTFNEERIGQRIGAYEIVREIGHGGMGSVFLAVRADDQYRKQVAIKLVKRGMDTDAILRRFMMERQILANLEHPNIARLLEGGSTTDGLPYFVMEYVEGQPITEYCDAHQLTTLQRLDLFRPVCSALHYAHQNLVVHRDIKPGNILVNAEGVPKLLDFGIAKLLNPGWTSETGDGTFSMVRMMTPEYASPEQFRGSKITTASDVYSLGLVLYQMLSGHHPYQLKSRQPEEVARVILEEEPEKPSSASSRQKAGGSELDVDIKTTPKALRGDLDNIVLKALRKEPERRYATVQEFAEDIRRHLDGLPVIASPDTFGYRATKFVQRNKPAAIAVFAVVITLLSATAITTWQARVAKRERAKAEQRFNDVRKLANSVVFELHDSIENLPGSTPARELLVSRALEYLDKLASEATTEPSLQLELAAAYDKIGDIQGGFGTSHLGQREKASESYKKGLAIREALVSQQPHNIEFLRQLSTSYTKLGQVLWIQVDQIGALDAYGKALEISKRLAAELPKEKQIRLDLAKTHGNFGYLLGVNNRAEEAEANLRQAVVLVEELSAEDPNFPSIQYEQALAYDNLALILTDLKKEHAEALTLFRKSKSIGDAQLAADPQNVKLQRGQAVGDYNLAMVLAKLGDTTGALESSTKALATVKKILASDPTNDEFKQAVAQMQGLVCEMMIKTGKANEAIKLLTESLTLLEQSFAASPTDEIAHFRIAIVEANLGQAHIALTSDTKDESALHWRAAREWLGKSKAILDEFNAGGKLAGEDAERLSTVNADITKCDAALSRLNK